MNKITFNSFTTNNICRCGSIKLSSDSCLTIFCDSVESHIQTRMQFMMNLTTSPSTRYP